MAKNEDAVRVRLQRTALELFRERGYDQTTAAEIAARAGVTERTFFRHFSDKREVLFDGEAKLRAALTTSIADAPEKLGPLATLFHAFRSVVPALEHNRPFSKPRHEVISGTPALHEREMAKMGVLTDALAAALRARGVADLRAALAARTGMAAFVQATVAWLDDPEPEQVPTMPIQLRHCEERSDAAIQEPRARPLDCFVASAHRNDEDVASAVSGSPLNLGARLDLAYRELKALLADSDR